MVITQEILDLAREVFAASTVQAPPPSTCIIWVGTLAGSRGYGQASLGGEIRMYAHRLAYLIKHGRIPRGLHVLHRCDVPPCVNAEHLFAGTRDDNMLDMVTKGRQARGSALPQAKLDEAKVHEIQALLLKGVPGKELAEVYGVCRQTIDNVRRARCWGHEIEAVPAPTHHERGESHHNAKLDYELADEIRVRAAAGEQVRPLSREYGVSRAVIDRVVAGEAWVRS